MKITFLGATRVVTGSKYLIENKETKILVDCGLFQGEFNLRQRNWQELPIPPSEIKAIVLTHAHIDHTGYIPRLVKQGFKGNIYCSQATFELCSILLPDSGKIAEEDAKHANKHGYSHHKPALPLYTEAEARNSLQYFKPAKYHVPIQLGDDLVAELTPSEHILGASFITVTNGNRTLFFTGDLGRPHDPVMKTPSTPSQPFDYLVLESTYGDRLHTQGDPQQELADVINTTIKRGGVILIPAFAVGRTQIILYYLKKLHEAGKIPQIPVYLDSPMAINATAIFCKYNNEHRLSDKETADVCAVPHCTPTVNESIKLNDIASNAIIIAGSGMASGGRIAHHIKQRVGDPKNTILFTGYQARGTLGYDLTSGASPVMIHGEACPVRAQIKVLDNLSAHADYQEMLEWLSAIKTPPKKVFLIHGEEESMTAFKEKIEKQFGWHVVMPEYGQTEELG